ncbi:unnamed protein product, partial [Symbiodinium sp. KB8]
SFLELEARPEQPVLFSRPGASTFFDYGYNHWWRGQCCDASHQRWERCDDSAGRWSDVKDEVTRQAEHFLHDFALTWMLLQCSGLDQNEKANLKNEFTMDQVKDVDEDEEIGDHDDLRQGGNPVGAPRGHAEEEYRIPEAEIQEALPGIQLQKSTWKQATEKQQQISQKRKVFDQGRGRGLFGLLRHS